MSKLIEQFLPVVAEAGLNTNKNVVLGGTANLTVAGNLVVTGTISGGAEATTSQAITSASANAFAVGLAGTTNPAFNVDASTASSATGLTVKSAAAASGVALTVTSSGTDENFSINAKGAGYVAFNNVATGFVYFNSKAGSYNNSANSLFAGQNGSTNPAFNVDTSTASSATGINIKSAAAAAGLAVTTISTGTDENLTVAAKGAGSVTFNPAVVAAAGGKVSSGIQFGSLSVGLYTGTGAPSFSAMNGSIYVDSNATTTTTRIYVNKSGAGTAGTTWTNLTTAA